MNSTPKLYNKKFQAIMSDEDEGIPTGYISLFDFLTVNCVEQGIFGYDTAVKKRTVFFINLVKKFNNTPAEKIDDFYNFYKDSFISAGLNPLYEYAKIRDIARYIECFAKKSIRRNNVKQIVSFGIDVNKINEYAEAKRKAVLNNTDFIMPEPKKCYLKRDDVMCTYKTLTFGETKVEVLKNNIYQRFEHWCFLKGEKIGKAILEALNFYVEKNPLYGVLPLQEYNKPNVLDKIAKIKHKKIKDEQTDVQIPLDIKQKMIFIIENYNNDPNNFNGDKLDVSQYVTNAVKLLNVNMPLKYSDPEAHIEVLKLKDGVDFNG